MKQLNKAYAHALSSQPDLALKYLVRALAQTDSDFDSIRDNEQFQALLNGT